MDAPLPRFKSRVRYLPTYTIYASRNLKNYLSIFKGNSTAPRLELRPSELKACHMTTALLPSKIVNKIKQFGVFFVRKLSPMSSCEMMHQILSGF